MDDLQIDKLKNDTISLCIQIISDCKRQNIPYNEFHFRLQKILAEKSVLFNLSSRREYPTNIKRNQIGFIDVVWLNGLKPLVAFEIDSRFYIRSIWKLLAIDSDLRFWVYYNDMTEDEIFIFRGKNKDKLITLVKFPVTFNCTPEEIIKIDNSLNRSLTRPRPKSTKTQNTFLLTYHLIQKDFTIDEIANQRGLKRDTIINHIFRLNQMGYEINIDKFVLKEKQKVIIDATQLLSNKKLSELKDYLGDNYSYEEIRLVLATINQRCNNTENEKMSMNCIHKIENEEIHYTFDEIRTIYPRAYVKWTIEDDEKLKKEFLAGKNIEELAIIFQRKDKAIESRLEKIIPKLIIDDFFE